MYRVSGPRSELVDAEEWSVMVNVQLEESEVHSSGAAEEVRVNASVTETSYLVVYPAVRSEHWPVGDVDPARSSLGEGIKHPREVRVVLEDDLANLWAEWKRGQGNISLMQTLSTVKAGVRTRKNRQQCND